MPYRIRFQFMYKKNMASVLFTTIPCEPNTTNRNNKRKLCMFGKFVPVLITLYTLGLELLEYLCVFL